MTLDRKLWRFRWYLFRRCLLSHSSYKVTFVFATRALRSILRPTQILDKNKAQWAFQEKLPLPCNSACFQFPENVQFDLHWCREIVIKSNWISVAFRLCRAWYRASRRTSILSVVFNSKMLWNRSKNDRFGWFGMFWTWYAYIWCITNTFDFLISAA